MANANTPPNVVPQRIALIAAIGKNYVLGKDNELVWHLPADWENFRRVTKDKPFVMGRTSYESSDMLYSEGRNIILTSRNLEGLPDNFEVARGIPEALARLKEEPEVFILGGGKVYEQTIDLANYLYLTLVHHDFDGDTFFPKPQWDQWLLVKSVYQAVDERHQYDFSLNEYRRK
ncbi:MAG: dihydrofolate reductase [Bacteroidota bacterium]